MRAAVQGERRHRERARLVPVVRGRGHARHDVRCPGCADTFELFSAAWCECAGHRSKICQACGACACAQPSYSDPRMWAKAPPLFVREGFDRLFVAYL